MGKQCTHQLLFFADYADVCISINLCISDIGRELGVSVRAKFQIMMVVCVPAVQWRLILTKYGIRTTLLINIYQIIDV